MIAGAFIFDVATLQLVGRDEPTLLKYLKSEKYLNTEKYPIASFILQKMEDGTLSGILTMSGVSKSISFPALVLIGDDTLRIRADFSLDRSDFGLPVSEEVTPFLDIHIQWVFKK